MRTLGILLVILTGLLVPGPGYAQSVCENACEDCSYDDDLWYNVGWGVGFHMTWMAPTGSCTGQFSCVPWEECRGPEKEDAKPQEVLEAELDRLLALERDQVPDWVTANRGDFHLAVVDGTLQVANRCGAVITWVALACPRRADPGRMRVQRPEREEGLRDEETTYTRADRGKAA